MTEVAAPAEQAADLAALTATANQAEAAQAAATNQAQAEAQAPQQPSASALQLAAMAVGMLRPLIVYAVPALRNAPDELWEPIPEGVAGVLDHYGMQPEWLESPWARLAFAAAPLAAFAAIQTMNEKPKEPDRIAGPDLSAAPPEEKAGQNTVTIGAPVAVDA